jgi:predicted TIM-barrel fold metal-dependent hydrolase
MAMTVLDADGHVTETAQQLVKYMDAPYRDRQLSFPLVPSDGWDRRLITKFHDSAGTAEAWLEALDRGGMEQAVLFPTLGLFMSFLKDRAWAVQFCRAYNTFMHEEFIKVSPRLKAVALLPIQDPEASARELRRAVRAQEEAERLHTVGQDLLLVRGRRVAPAPGAEAGRREPDRLRVRLPALGSQLPGSIDEIRDRGDLTDTQKRKVLADNCRKLYKL